MPSGVITSYPLMAPLGTKASVVLTQGQQPSTPAGTTTELYVSRCRGVINTAGAQCYYKGVFVNNNAITSYTKPVFTWVDQATLGSQGGHRRLKASGT